MIAVQLETWVGKIEEWVIGVEGILVGLLLGGYTPIGESVNCASLIEV